MNSIKRTGRPTPPAKKQVKAPTKAVKKTATKKAVTKPAAIPASRRQSHRKPGSDNGHGYQVGSDFGTISALLVAGASSRAAVTEKVRDAIGDTSASGKKKNLSSMVSTTIRELESRGYTLEQTFRMVPPAGKHIAHKPVLKRRKLVRGK